MATIRFTHLVVFASCITACVATTDDGGPSTDNRDRSISTEPTPATIPIRTPSGVVQVPVSVDARGRAFVDDMGFGSIHDMRPRSVSLSDLDTRWPSGVVHYAFRIEANCPEEVADVECVRPSDQARFEEATRYIHDRVPAITFQKHDEANAPSDFALVVRNGEDKASHADVGFCGGEQEIAIARGAPIRTMVHEIGHALGLKHEHQRPDRDTFLQVCTDNVASGKRGNYDKLDFGDVDTLTPYDFHSRMHYGANQFPNQHDGDEEECDLAGLSFPCTINDNNPSLCDGHSIALRAGVDTVTDNLADPTTLGVQTSISGNDDYSSHDINALSLMYAKALGKTEGADMFGWSVAAADFDRDGYDDVAIGVYGEDIDGGTDRGSVFVYKGTEKGPVPWKRLSLGDAVPEQAGQRFGAALAVGDFNGDGFPDLAVSAPSYDGGAANTGLVAVFRGGAFRQQNYSDDALSWLARGTWPRNDGFDERWQPLTLWRILRSSDGGESEQRSQTFGQTLASGDFDGDGLADLAIGAPGHDARRGKVWIHLGSGMRDHAPITRAITAGTWATPNAEFGTSLAVGRIYGSRLDDLVVGAPYAASGAVFAFGSAMVPLLFGGRPSLQMTLRDRLVPPGDGEPGMRFGVSVAVGRVRATSVNVVVGAPQTRTQVAMGGTPEVRGGAVFVHSRVGTSPPAWLPGTRFLTKNITQDEYFGSSLALIDMNGDGMLDVAVGAPAHASGAGRVALLTADGFNLIETNEVFGGIDAGGFGSALAIGNVRGLGLGQATRLLVGAPYSKVTTGTPPVSKPSAGALWGFAFETPVRRSLYLAQHSTSLWAR